LHNIALYKFPILFYSILFYSIYIAVDSFNNALNHCQDKLTISYFKQLYNLDSV